MPPRRLTPSSRDARESSATHLHPTLAYSLRLARQGSGRVYVSPQLADAEQAHALLSCSLRGCTHKR